MKHDENDGRAKFTMLQPSLHCATCSESVVRRARNWAHVRLRGLTITTAAVAVVALGCSGVEDVGDDEISVSEESAIVDDSRIVGGTNAKHGEFPFFIQGDGCGASLIWSDIALSAAHCKTAFSKVIVGAYRFGQAIQGATSNVVTKKMVHPQYRPASMKYDFMVMKLEKHVDSASRKQIRLNSDGQVPADNDFLTVIGFGETMEKPHRPKILQKVNVQYVSYKECIKNYSANSIDRATMLCAGVDGGGKDSCWGDSGGPIFNQSGVQVGVVSWGDGCARPRYPGVYSRVSAAHRWIQNAICKLSSKPPQSCATRTDLY